MNRRGCVGRAAAVLIVLVLAGVLWSCLKRGAATSDGARIKAAEAKQKEAEPRAKHSAPPQVFHVVMGAGEEEMRLSMGEIVLRDADGKESTRELSPPATLATLRARMAEYTAPGGVFPVAKSSRGNALVTRELRVKLGNAGSERAFAKRHSLVVQEKPSYAPGWVIFSASDPLDALRAMEEIRASGDAETADVLLATQRVKKLMPNDTLIANQWHLKKNTSTRTDINVETAWAYGGTGGVRGNGIRIGIVDDGLETAHPDLSPNADTVNDHDWNGNDNDPSPTYYDDHGTACAGVAAARGNNALGVSGSAPEATLVGMRLIAAGITDSQDASAVAYLPDLIQIKSNSWGPGDGSDILDGPGPLCTAAIQNAATTGRQGKGTIMLWAGGNGNSLGDNSNYDGYSNSIYTIAVAASDYYAGQAYYSEPGSNIVVCAPSSGLTGLDITTTDQTGSWGYDTTSDYTSSFGGTSSATPAVAGVCALLLEKNPALGWRDVQEILIRSAYKIKPTDADWINNAAGIHFNHKFGAGLVDATAAVTMAGGWTNLKTQQVRTVTQSGLNVAIPENTSTGITRSFVVTGQQLRAEHVTVTLSASHTSRGNLAISLVSPSGTESILAEVRDDTNNNYSSWTFSTVRNWGESANGTWQLKIADLSGSGNTSGGTLTYARLDVYGAIANQDPVVTITSPADGASLSPGASVAVNVSVTDVSSTGGAGVISQVELFDNGVSLGIDTVAPYAFPLMPSTGSHSYVAVATDSEGASGSSAPVQIVLENHAPVISAVSVSPSGQAYADEDVSVVGLSTSDADGDMLAISYQWQSSGDGFLYSDAVGATGPVLTAQAGRTGKLWRCLISVSDGVLGASALTDPVNVLERPVLTVARAESYVYQSGLVIPSSFPGISRSAILNEFSQGSLASGSEWVEMLVLADASFRGWKLVNGSGAQLVFANSSVWDGIPVGTLVVIYDAAHRDPLLPANDFDASDGRMVIPSNNTTYFSSPASWPGFADGGTAVVLKNALGAAVAGISYGSDATVQPHFTAVAGLQVARFDGGQEVDASVAGNWTVSSAAVAPPDASEAYDLIISEYIEGSSTNRAVEIYNPTGQSINLGANAYQILIYYNGSSTAGIPINLSGVIAPGGTYTVKEPTASGVIIAQASTVNLAYNGDDAVVLAKGTEVVDSLGKVGQDPGAGWTSGGASTVNATLRRKPGIHIGDRVTNDAFDPSVEWDAYAQNTFDGIGSHEMSPFLMLELTNQVVQEAATGVVSTATIRVPVAPTANLVVSLSPSVSGVLDVPATVTIPSGQYSATFSIETIDDALATGTQEVNLVASATGYEDGLGTLRVVDDEMPEGECPGAANSLANAGLIADLQSGAYDVESMFRLAAGSVLPAGLVLDAGTGLVSGVVTATAGLGNYPITIERYTASGAIVSQSYTLQVTSGLAGYAAWIAGYPGVSSLSAPSDDADHDGIANAIENILGTDPTLNSAGLAVVSGGGGALVVRHTRANEIAADLSYVYEWSLDLENWAASGENMAGITASVSTSMIEDHAAPANDVVEVAVTTSPATTERVFLRMKAVKTP